MRKLVLLLICAIIVIVQVHAQTIHVTGKIPKDVGKIYSPNLI